LRKPAEKVRKNKSMANPAPQRTCIACRKVFDKKTLLRFVLDPDDNLLADLNAKLPGRGVYTCFSVSCVAIACEKKAFSRAFKKEARCSDSKATLESIVKQMEERIASYIALANKAGKIISGGDMVADSIRKESTGKRLVLLASDISVDIGRKICFLAQANGVRHEIFFDKNRLGELVGKGFRSVIAVQGNGFVESLIKEIDRYRNFLAGEGCVL
jgi:uncharacterized protein